MKISELPRGLKELAELRLQQYPDLDPFFKDSLHVTSIRWEDTPEGEEFWDNVEEKNFTQYYNCKVVKFKLKEK